MLARKLRCGRCAAHASRTQDMPRRVDGVALAGNYRLLPLSRKLGLLFLETSKCRFWPNLRIMVALLNWRVHAHRHRRL